jgi:hypothetical protein
MALERGQVDVDDVRFGRQTELRERVLFIDNNGLSDFLLSRDRRIESCIVSIARPGDSTRIFCVKDV